MSYNKKKIWEKLLSRKRLDFDGEEDKRSGRSPFQRDFDRIAFSSAFRRLQDKTQGHPLVESDYIRTRLTHSIEASCVARSLGSIVGKRIIEKHKLKSCSDADFGAIVAAASLAHDIGNPPLGHSGEDAVKHWFRNSTLAKNLLKKLRKEQRQDFIDFEGNAQGFRVLTCLQRPDNPGMQLTCATLAAFTKYPRSSYLDNAKLDKQNAILKKHGFFVLDRKSFIEVANEVGLIEIIKDKAWCRHPLSYLVEAADDICYKIIDFEDGARLGLVTYDKVKELFLKVIPKKKHATVEKELDGLGEEKEKIECLRSKVINELIIKVTQRFMKNEDAILSGDFNEDLINKKVEIGEAVHKIYELSRDKIYTAKGVVEIEAAGFEVLGGLLEVFLGAVTEAAEKQERGEKPSKKSEKILQLIPVQFLKAKVEVDDDLYTRIIQITDFVSGMTDSFAVSTYKKIKGISLPHG